MVVIVNSAKSVVNAAPRSAKIGIKMKLSKTLIMALVTVAIMTLFSFPSGISTMLIKKLASSAGISAIAKIASEASA